MCWNGNTFPFFLFEGQRVVEPFPTGIQITDKIPAGSHGLFPRDFSFACRCGVVVMALVEVAGFSLLLPLPSCRTFFSRLLFAREEGDSAEVSLFTPSVRLLPRQPYHHQHSGSDGAVSTFSGLLPATLEFVCYSVLYGLWQRGYAHSDAYPRLHQPAVLLFHFFVRDVHTTQGYERAVDAVHSLERQRAVRLFRIQLGYGALVHADCAGKLAVGG